MCSCVFMAACAFHLFVRINALAADSPQAKGRVEGSSFLGSSWKGLVVVRRVPKERLELKILGERVHAMTGGNPR